MIQIKPDAKAGRGTEPGPSGTIEILLGGLGAPKATGPASGPRQLRQVAGQAQGLPHKQRLGFRQVVDPVEPGIA